MRNERQCLSKKARELNFTSRHLFIQQHGPLRGHTVSGEKRVYYINLTNELSHRINKSTRTIMYFNKKC